MKVEQKNHTTENPKKRRPLLIFLGVAAVVLICIVISINSVRTSEIELLHLGTLQEMNKEQVIKLLGEPDEIIKNSDTEYSFGYNNGLYVSGTEQGVYEIVAAKDMVKKDNKTDYELFGLGIDSSYESTVNRLGKPNLSLTTGQKKTAVYLLNDVDFLLILKTAYNSDLITDIRYASYNDSSISSSFDLGKLLVREYTEDELKGNYSIKDRQSSSNGVLYSMEGFNIWVDKQNNVQNINVSSESLYNFRGLRMHDTLEKANQLFGKPIDTSEGVSNTTRYTYNYEDGPNTCLIHISIKNDSKDIQYIEAQRQYNVNTATILPSNDTEVKLQNMWSVLDNNSKTEINRYFSNFSEVDFGTNPYIKDSTISNYSPDELIKFAIEHNLQFGQGNSFDFDLNDDEYLTMHGDLVSEVIDYYFGLTISNKSVIGYEFKEDRYRWDAYRWSYIEPSKFSQVQSLVGNSDDTLTAEISIYVDSTPFDFNTDYEQVKSKRYVPETNWIDNSLFQYIGSAEATIKKSSTGDWQLIKYEVTSMY